jgi:predicted solute-binding protein
MQTILVSAALALVGATQGPVLTRAPDDHALEQAIAVQSERFRADVLYKVEAAQGRVLEARLKAVDEQTSAKLESAALAKVANALGAAEPAVVLIEASAAAPDAPRLLRF